MGREVMGDSGGGWMVWAFSRAGGAHRSRGAFRAAEQPAWQLGSLQSPAESISLKMGSVWIPTALSEVRAMRCLLLTPFSRDWELKS